MTTYKLRSTPLINAPSLISHVIHSAKSRHRDHHEMAGVVCKNWNDVPAVAAMALITQAVPFTVDGETVVFEFGSLH